MVEEATQPSPADDFFAVLQRFVGFLPLANRRRVVDAVVRPEFVVMARVLGQHTIKVLLPEHDEFPQALLFDGLNPPFHERVLVGRVGGWANDAGLLRRCLPAFSTSF
jgi:hypothetical protein